MLVLALDISSCSGFALLEGDQGKKPKLLFCGSFELDKSVKDTGPDPYPWTVWNAANRMAGMLAKLALDHRPDAIVIEDTNLGKQRTSQKYLEQTHCLTLQKLAELGHGRNVVYLSTSTWRSTVQLWLTKEEKAANAKLSRAKSKARQTGGTLNKGVLGIKGKVTWKHLAVARANKEYGLNLLMKHNDCADAILLGMALFMGAKPDIGE